MHERQNHSFTALTTHTTKTKFNQPLMTLAKESLEPIMPTSKSYKSYNSFFDTVIYSFISFLVCQGSTFKQLSLPSIIWQDIASN